MKPKFDTRRFEIYKEAYDRELERRGEAIDRLSGVITIYTIIGGIIAFFATELPDDLDSVTTISFAVIFALGVISALIGLILLAIQIFCGTNYKVLNTAKALDDKIMPVATSVPDDDQTDSECVRQLDLAILDQYRDFSTYNQIANNRREKKYTLVLKFGTFAAIALICAAGPFLYERKNHSDPSVKVLIENPIKVMSNTTPDSDSTPSSSKDDIPEPSNPSKSHPIKFEIPGGITINESFGVKHQEEDTSGNIGEESSETP